MSRYPLRTYRIPTLVPLGHFYLILPPFHSRTQPLYAHSQPSNPVNIPSQFIFEGHPHVRGSPILSRGHYHAPYRVATLTLPVAWSRIVIPLYNVNHSNTFNPLHWYEPSVSFNSHLCVSTKNGFRQVISLTCILFLFLTVNYMVRSVI